MPFLQIIFLYFAVKVNCVFYIIYQCEYKLLWNAISTGICVSVGVSRLGLGLETRFCKSRSRALSFA